MRSCGLSPRSLSIVEKVKEILNEYHGARLTLRQIYYRLVASQEIKNSRSSYNSLSSKLAQAREKKLISPEAIEDRNRRIDGEILTWESPQEYTEALRLWTYAKADDYTRDIWATCNKYVEVWTEKDALSNLLSQAASRYRVPVAVCRGYSSLTFLYEAVMRFSEQAYDKEGFILYFGDFDPSGEDMVRDIRDRLQNYFEIWDSPINMPTIKKVSLTRDELDKYNLPPVFTKKSDTRAQKFIKRHGDIAVELDALPPDILINRVEESIKAMIDDQAAWKELQNIEDEEKQEILENLEAMWGVNDRR